jgi:hypothetical protein
MCKWSYVLLIKSKISTNFLPNYLCSSLSFKRYYDIAPIHLSIIKSGVSCDSSISLHLLNFFECISKFNEATFNINQSLIITKDTLIKTNSILTDNNTGIRNISCRVGKDICPEPSKIEYLIEHLINFINSPHLTLDDFIYIYFKFISIHPFEDGNGRVSRILFYFLTKGSVDCFYCPFLYHTPKNHLNYVKLVKLAQGSKKLFYRSPLLKKFKNEAYQKILLLKMNDDQLQINLKKKLFDNDNFNLVTQIYQKLYKSPALPIKELMESSLGSEISVEVLNNLVSKNIIKIKQSQGGEIYIFSEHINKMISVNHELIIKGKVQ